MNPHNSLGLSAPASDTGPGGGGAQSGGTLAETKQKIAQTARDTAAKVKNATSDTVAKAKDEAQRIATEKKDAAAERLGGYSSAIRDTARAIEEKDPNIAWFTNRAAEKLQSVADYVRDRDFASLRGDCESMARRHPAVFFGGMFFAGLLVGNMMKASRRRYDDDHGDFDSNRQSELDWSAQRNDDQQSMPDLNAAERGAAGI